MSDELVLFWSLSSVILGAGFLIAAKNLWLVRMEPGSLIPFLFSLFNGIYEIVFGVLVLIARLGGVGADANIIFLWLAVYIPARASSIGLALVLSGQVSDGWIRKLFRL